MSAVTKTESVDGEDGGLMIDCLEYEVVEEGIVKGFDFYEEADLEPTGVAQLAQTIGKCSVHAS